MKFLILCDLYKVVYFSSLCQILVFPCRLDGINTARAVENLRVEQARSSCLVNRFKMRMVKRQFNLSYSMGKGHS